MTLIRNEFKHSLKAGTPQIGVWSALSSTYVAELIAGVGYDWVLLDAEHAPNDVPEILQQLQAVAAAIPVRRNHGGNIATSAVVRSPWNDLMLIKRYLDVGAQTLLIPFVQNAEEARAAVAATRYPPSGTRGMGGSMRASNFGRIPDYPKRAHDELCVLVQVETREALDQIEAIAAVDGIDGIFIGPADLSASMGFPGNPRHPEVDQAIDQAIRRVRACGKAPGILMVDERRARECLELGALFIAVAMDLIALRSGLEKAIATFGEPADGPPSNRCY